MRDHHLNSEGAAAGAVPRPDSAIQGRGTTPGRIQGAILALDQGTTSSRAFVFDRDGQVLSSASRELVQHYPRPGWVEHDPWEIWHTQMEAAREALARASVDGAALAAIGIANQRETALLWDAETGAPVGNAVVWQCRRTAERCAALRSEGREGQVRRITGLPLDPYFSATKLEWLLAAHPEARQLLRRGRLRCGTVDSFLIWHLSGGRQHVTDVSNASRTMLFDLRSLDWDDELLRLFGIPREILPQPVPSAGVVAHTEPALFGAPVPIAGVAGDQQAALFGQACFAPGDTKNTYGTGCFLLMNTGAHPVVSSRGLVSTIAWALDEGLTNVAYALEGSVFAGGAAVQWLRDGLGIIQAADEIGPLAATVKDNGGVYFVPALTGLGAPFWDPAARGLLIGLTRGTRQGHLARATEEAICYQIRAVLEAMVADAGAAPSLLKVDGGAVGDALLLQLQADVLQLPVRRQALREATAFGAAALAALGVGLWSLQDVADRAAGDRTFEPGQIDDSIEQSYRLWLRAVERAQGWAT